MNLLAVKTVKNAMKTIISNIAVLALATGLHASEQAKEPMHAVKIVGIEANLVKTPQFLAKGVPNKDLEARQWLEIEAEVEVKTSDPSGYIPALQAEWFVMVKQEIEGQSKAFPFKLEGVSKYKDIRTKDGKIYLSAYIEPKTLERFFGDGRLRESDFKSLALKLSGEGLMSGGRTAICTNEDFAKMLQGDWKFDYSDSGIVPKSKTPFALINIDRYPTEETGQ